MKTILSALAISLAVATAAPAVADSGDDAKANDPNRMVCKRIEVIGSRLQTQRVCMTAGEWAAKKAADRQGTEQTQNARWKNTPDG